MAFLDEFQHLELELEDIKSATENFSENKVIGRGGFGKVYVGQVSHYKGQSLVAIKRLDPRLGQGSVEFLKELMMLSRYTHRNLISLLGFCDDENEKILVYEHASNGSLDNHLSNTALTWTQRVKICLDAATGLDYLHDDRGTQQRVIHRDIKSANILLDEKWNAKVSDMGLSKFGPANQQYSYVFTNLVGTHGYVDPLYMKTYTLTKESDVYSFGVVLFEVLCGRLCFQFDKEGRQLRVFVPMWKQSYTEKKLEEIIFHDLKQQMDPTSLEAFSDIAFQCLSETREERPTMSLVVEKLKVSLKRQEISDHQKQWLIYYKENLNGNKKRFSLNAKGEHCEIISIAACLIPYEDEDYTSQYSHDYNSRFAAGSYLTNGKKFKTRVRSQFLSPLITYTVNLIFICSLKEKAGEQQYVAIKYKVEGETKVSIVYLADKKEDEWLKAGLYQFSTNQSIVDLEIMFEGNTYVDWLIIDGFEFQPLEHVEVEHDYQEILNAVVPPLIYKSVEELNILLSKGVLLNEGKTWFYINDNGEHCEMISIAECLIPVAEQDYQHLANYNSRFAAGAYYALNCKFKTRVRAQFLSARVTYTVNLVFKFHEREVSTKRHIFLEHKLDGETKYSTSYLAYEREDGWLMAELYQFTSDGKTVDIDIIFGDNQGWILIEGIEFQPLEKVVCQALEDETEVDIQTISASDAYWDEILPKNYVDIITWTGGLVGKFLSTVKIKKKWSKNGVQWKTKKELYSIIRRGVLMDNGEEWLSLDKKGKRCQMLSTRAILDSNDKAYQYSPDSRFGEVLVLEYDHIHLLKDINPQVLSPQTTYASYLVYKFPENQSKYEGPLVVRYNDLESDKFWYIYLVSPQTPVIRQNNNENSHNRVNRPKLRGIPQQRNDGWMEVQVWEFQIGKGSEMIHMSLGVTAVGLTPLSGLIMEGIESRPL